MLKRNIAIFFTVLFMAIIATPTVIIVLDDTIDISVFYSISEEEEKNKLELVYLETKEEGNSFIDFLKRKKTAYYFKKYPKPHLNLISPPPDFI